MKLHLHEKRVSDNHNPASMKLHRSLARTRDILTSTKAYNQRPLSIILQQETRKKGISLILTRVSSFKTTHRIAARLLTQTRQDLQSPKARSLCTAVSFLKQNKEESLSLILFEGRGLLYTG